MGGEALAALGGIEWAVICTQQSWKSQSFGRYTRNNLLLISDFSGTSIGVYLLKKEHFPLLLELLPILV